MNTAERICAALEALGADTVFGLPGSQNVGLFSALGRSKLRTVVATSETAAAFMANGYARVTRRPGVLFTIPGPGFTFALSGIAEAFLDSVPLVHVAGAPATAPGRRFQLQAIDQAAMAAPITKAVLAIADPADADSVMQEAYALSLNGEPGPVLVHVVSGVLAARSRVSPLAETDPPLALPADLGVVDARLRRARRPILYAGQGALTAGPALAVLARTYRAPILTTTSGRGVVPESHPWVVPSDLAPWSTLAGLFDEADLVVALGVKFSHNGARGFRLHLDREKLVHVDASAENLGANYPAGESVLGDVGSVVQRLLSFAATETASTWTEAEVDTWRLRLAEAGAADEPRLKGLRPSAPRDFFAALGRLLPVESSLVLDSGKHQMLARRYFRADGPANLVLPTNFQSMGFGIPAAIGAKVGAPGRRVVALVGDGGFALCGLELLTAVREGLDLTVIVFNDGYFGLIRDQQTDAHGTSHGTRLHNPDFSRFAQAVGARYLRLRGPLEPALRSALDSRGIVVAEVVVADSIRSRLGRFRSAIAARARRLARLVR